MAATSIGSYYEPQNLNPNDRTPQKVTYYQGFTVGSGADADLTLSALGAFSGTSDFYLTDVFVGLRHWTATGSYNLLYAGDTIATLGKEGCQLHFEPGLKALSTVLTSTLQTLALVMSNTAATGTAAGIIAQGYTK